ncbi:MAG: DUF5777 family beta-barrel protein [Candidatus Polarisedimenticolia bacterium]
MPAEAEAYARAAPILQASCAMPGCHLGADAAAGMRLEAAGLYRNTVNVRSTTDPDRLRVSPGRPDQSLLYLKLLPPDQGHYRGPRMPQGLEPLSDEKISHVRRWIESFPTEAWGEPAEEQAPAIGERSFHDSHLINLPTTDPLGRGALEFRILHRFKSPARDAGGEGLYGLDSGAFVSIGLAWGVGERADVGIRRTSLDLTGPDFELHGRWIPIRQRPGGPPLSLALRASATALGDDGIRNRDRYTAQAIVARRFGPRLSLLLAPTYVARADTLSPTDRSGSVAIGVGAELHLSPKMAISGEWIRQTSGFRNTFQGGSIAWSVATARHVFQILASNTPSAHTDLYAPGGDLEWGEGDFRLGFNISRIYTPRRSPRSHRSSAATPVPGDPGSSRSRPPGRR